MSSYLFHDSTSLRKILNHSEYLHEILQDFQRGNDTLDDLLDKIAPQGNYFLKLLYPEHLLRRQANEKVLQLLLSTEIPEQLLNLKFASDSHSEQVSAIQQFLLHLGIPAEDLPVSREDYYMSHWRKDDSFMKELENTHNRLFAALATLFPGEISDREIFKKTMNMKDPFPFPLSDEVLDSLSKFPDFRFRYECFAQNRDSGFPSIRRFSCTPLAFALLARIFWQNADYEKAFFFYAYSALFEIDYLESPFQLGFLYCSSWGGNMYHEGWKWMEKTLPRVRLSGDIRKLLTIGQCCYMAGETDQGLSILKEAAAKGSEQANELKLMIQRGFPVDICFDLCR